MVSESLDIQVLVRALYDFDSEDATNLTFKKDDVIQVLAQLESGWWAGYCQGRQGWFPSNYVEVLGEDDLDSQDEDDEEYAEGDDLDSADDLWLPQTTPDGQVFYYNQRTQESSWTIPESEDQASMGTAATGDQEGSGKAGWSVRESTSNGNGWYNSEAEDEDQDAGQEIQEGQDEDDDGRLSVSSSNHHNANNLKDASEAQTLAAVRKPSGLAPTPQESVEGLPPLPLLPNPFDPEPTWTSLAEHTAAAVQNLVSSAENGYKPYYLIQSSIVVEAIRVMLYASGTVDKDAAIMRQHRGLKMHHRQIMAALSKLVLSAKMASGVWPASDAVAKLLADAREVGIAAQNYVTTAMAANITVHQVDARLVTDVKSPLKEKAESLSLNRALSNGSGKGDPSSNDRKVFGSQMSTQSILSQLDYYSKSASKAVSVLAMQIEKLIESPSLSLRSSGIIGISATNPVMNSSQSAQLVTQARQTVSQLGSLLTLVTDFSSSTLAEQPRIPEKLFMDVKNSKQALHRSTASLVIAIQSATDLLAVGQTLELALATTLSTDQAAQSLAQATRVLIQEKEIAEANVPLNRASTDLYGGGRKPSLAPQPDGNYNYDHDSDIEPELSIRNSNARSDVTSQRTRVGSQPSIFSGTSGTQTPAGTEYSGRAPQGGYPFPPSASLEGNIHGNGSNFANSSVPGRYDLRGDKLKKILGDDAPTRPSAQTWFLDYDYQRDDLILNAEGQVKGGTLPALIERLTLHDGLDSNFIATFLLSYRSFTTTKELFQHLFLRFTIQSPAGLDAEELEIWTEKKLTPIRLRVFNIIKSWLENYYLEDEVDDKEALSMIKDFSGSTAMKDTMSFAAVQLIKLVEKREQSDGAFRKMVLNLTTQAPQPITPRNLKKIKFLEIDPLEFARQLTIMEAAVYNKIRPVECLAKAWTSDDPEVAAKAVNIKKMIETSNLLSNWINELVLSEKEIRKRVLVIRHLVLIAEKLRQLNNFSVLSAAMAALSLSPIHRLKRTWEQVPQRTITSFMELQTLMGVAKNWAEYREELHSANPPCVPFVGMYLTDLVMIQDGNSDFLKKSNHLINFYKRVKTAEVIREIQQYQSVPYCLTPVPEIQAFIRRGMDGTKSVADLYDMSLALEPRERGDEKIARMLTESGML
ncbi:ras guanine nucleotide exchange factor domain-containing protein [Gamsiella multidivaricata]|uniref:ras guanine nucleotide exchange factor domain-containing protein n=1 Tax=Gamsiella multidivaricata TaxID=101098 RepID=UPI00221EF113|nr:ras guanine nucleotide exchange factor domain-containing protein [Gamsiella multidivaricata]KAI7828926.1 ras guanine nucleotide exchange factor domain-containing protein [Gamsiella multidivaricata]